ncbi:MULTISPECIES: PilZ domain-containing protein [Rheinheimera]|uniref:PilZ domain-containing protein n=1 Tax=Rheinheimera marina TaxID=1774958 RepID=A0ABV9JQM0_9GAMM
MLGQNDKRNYFRMMVNSQVQIMVTDPETGRMIDGICRDLSSTGMSLEVDEPLEMGILLFIKMETNNPSIPPLSAHARVVRCAQEHEDCYQLGVQIVEMN